MRVIVTPLPIAMDPGLVRRVGMVLMVVTFGASVLAALAT